VIGFALFAAPAAEPPDVIWVHLPNYFKTPRASPGYALSPQGEPLAPAYVVSHLDLLSPNVRVQWLPDWRRLLERCGITSTSAPAWRDYDWDGEAPTETAGKRWHRTVRRDRAPVER
jgi:hypothetical protein